MNWTPRACPTCGEVNTNIDVCIHEYRRIAIEEMDKLKREGMLMFPVTGAQHAEDSKAERQNPLDEMRHEIKSARRKLAFKLREYFIMLECLSETEFLEVVSELDGEGITISQLVEKHKRYTRADK